MHAALERFLTDLTGGNVKHDGDPDTARHMGNARVSARKDGRYMLTKPDRDRKIDAAVTAVLAHEAAADERAAGWLEMVSGPTYFRLPR
jgi:phage terminase large subunit-like protein